MLSALTNVVKTPVIALVHSLPGSASSVALEDRQIGHGPFLPGEGRWLGPAAAEAIVAEDPSDAGIPAAIDLVSGDN